MAAADEFTTRDFGTLGENGPDLQQFEAQHPEPGQGQRPQFSPVAQPGMNPEVWYHTVESGDRDRQPGGRAHPRRYYPKRRTVGMFSRLHEEHPEAGRE